MLEISLAYKDWLFYWSTKSKKTRKMLKKLKKIARFCKISVARGAFGTAKKVEST